MESKRLAKVPKRYRKGIESQLNGLSLAIQKKRESKGFTQEELAEKLDVSPTTIQFIEQGRRYPSLPMLFYVCSYLDIKIRFT